MGVFLLLAAGSVEHDSALLRAESRDSKVLHSVEFELRVHSPKT